MQHPSTLALNIGLKRGHLVTGFNTLAQTLEALDIIGFTVRAVNVVDSDSEPTAVVTVLSDSDWGVAAHQQRALHWVATALHQQAIAAFEPRRGHGVLVGPDAAAWGDFNPSLFFTIEGRRLSPLPRPAHAWTSATRDQSEDRAQPFTLAELAALAGS